MQENNSIICPIGRQKCSISECVNHPNFPDCQQTLELFSEFLEHPLYKKSEGKVRLDAEMTDRIQILANTFHIPYDLFYEALEIDLARKGLTLDSEE